jgi:hypothetical protein
MNRIASTNCVRRYMHLIVKPFAWSIFTLNALHFYRETYAVVHSNV